MNKKYLTITVWSLFILLNLVLIKNIVVEKNNLDKYFRLHVVANSNSIKDQSIKIKVAKEVQKKINELLKSSNTNSKENIKKTIELNIDNILLTANNSLKNQNSKLKASCNIGNIYYDKKEKKNIYMNAGVYDSIQIVIGEGKGKNFWSLIYPYSYAGMYELNNESLNNIEKVSTDNEENKVLTADDIIQNTNVEYASGILESIKRMWFN